MKNTCLVVRDNSRLKILSLVDANHFCNSLQVHHNKQQGTTPIASHMGMAASGIRVAHLSYPSCTNEYKEVLHY
jgi:hypothetical protein